MLSSTVFSGFFILLSSTFLNYSLALLVREPAQHEVRAPYEARVTPRFARRLHGPRPASTTYSNSSTTPIITSSSSSSLTTTAPFGITTTVISGTTFSLTYVSTTATQATTIVESNAQTTTTATYSKGGPIWIIPILPIGFPSPPPPPPPPPPIPPPTGGDGGGGGCEFGCESEGDNPTTTPNSQSSTTSSSTTSSSSSTPGMICSAGCEACNIERREARPTADPDKPKREITNLFRYGSMLQERNIPEGDGLPDIFNEVQISQDTLKVELAQGTGVDYFVGVSSSRFVAFDDQDHNIYVHGLRGCTSVIVVSRLGAFASHLWEAPGFQSRFQSDVLNYLTNELQPHTATFGDSTTTKIYIMTPATKENNLDGDGDLRNGNFPQDYENQITQITSLLNEILPNVPIEIFAYQRQRREALLESNVYGKAIVITSKILDLLR